VEDHERNSKTAEMLPPMTVTPAVPTSKEFQALHNKVTTRANRDSENNKTFMQNVASKVKNVWLNFWEKVRNFFSRA